MTSQLIDCTATHPNLNITHPYETAQYAPGSEAKIGERQCQPTCGKAGTCLVALDYDWVDLEEGVHIQSQKTFIPAFFEIDSSTM